MAANLRLVAMTEDHKNKLRTNLVYIKSELLVSAVVDHLFEKDKFFSKDRCDRVKAGEIEADKNERFLDFLSKGSEYSWKCFMEALDSTGQGFIRQRLEAGGGDNVDLQEAPPATTGEEINLKDQPDLSVTPTTASFHQTHKVKAYPMHNTSRGLVCIINVKTVVGEDDRTGTDIDRDNLIHLFKGLHFEVKHVYNDTDGLQAADILTKVKIFAGLAAHKQSQCAILCVLSHGSDGKIYGTDTGTVSIQDIRDCFNNSNCPALINKPKLLFFQACRGGTVDEGVDKKMDCSDDAKQSSHGDMLIGFPTHADYIAWRSQETGSWYISALVKVFSKRACDTDILTMMGLVRSLLVKNVSTDKQCSEEVMSLMKPFYFFPGITQKS